LPIYVGIAEEASLHLLAGALLLGDIKGKISTWTGLRTGEAVL